MTTGAPTPPEPHQPSGIRGFWHRRSWKGKTALIVGAILVALTIIGLAVPSTEDTNTTSPVVDDQADTTEPVTTEEATTDQTTTEPETTTEEAADEDTGRMSEGEYDEFTRFVTEVDEEIDQFGTTLQRCGVLFQAFELADASECVDEAYSGFQDKVDLAAVTVDDLKDDIAKECLEALTVYEASLDRFAAYVANLHEAGANLQTARFLKISKRARKETRRYAAARDTALLACAPL